MVEVDEMNGHVVFNGGSRLLKFFVMDDGIDLTKPLPQGKSTVGAAELRHTFECHDVGMGDGTQADEYGKDCKCPPGNYTLGQPIPSADPPGSDDVPYGFWFTPLIDTAEQDMEKHGRAGIGIHGGGSSCADPFEPRQGWCITHGCLRLQNKDNQTFVDSVRYIQKNGGKVSLTVFWP